LAGVENGLDADEPDERERYFQEALRKAMADLLTPMRA